AETKTSNGYRYSSASGTVRGTEMVSPEKERLRQ
ncbi:unnamed protein product, partial [Caenorhabditis auriculariae]